MPTGAGRNLRPLVGGILKKEDVKKIQIIAFTGFSESVSKKEAAALGIKGILEKTFKISDMSQML